MMPMSTLENTGAFSKMEQGWNIPPPDASNTSPFTRGMPTLGGNNEQGYRNGISQPPQHRLRSPTDSFGGGRGGAWGSSAPETATAPASALSSSVANALGGYNQPGSTIIGGFGDAANGGKSGSSSRRHSISVVGGPGGRRDFTFGEPGQGMSSVVSPPGRGLGPLGFSDVELLPEKLENALSLEIDESRRRGVEIEAGRGAGTNVFQASSLPKFDHHGEIHHRTNTSLRERDSAFVHDAPFGAMATSPGRGRAQQPGFIDERDSSGERKSSGERSRFSFDNSTSMLRPNDSGPTYALATPERGREVHAVNIGGLRGPGPIGGPAAFDARALTQPFGGPGGPLASHVQQAAIYPPSRPTGFPANILGAGPPSPVLSTHAAFGRTASGYAGYYGSAQLGSRPPTGGPYLNGPHFSPPGAQPTYQPSYSPPAPGSPNNPTSPSSFSSLSLADLGKGLPLTSLAPNTPLYVVTFKAGRRDVYYCPDPTLLISNGDRVIVEADRGSDLGIVVYDQLTPVEVREWQEKQATAALLSGASQHQPPGMVNASATIMAKPRGSSAGELGSTDLHTLLSGVGPSGQLDIGQTQARGPLAKEVMPKRIFARSSQGPEEQA